MKGNSLNDPRRGQRESMEPDGEVKTMKHTPGPWKAELIEHRPAYSKRERREEMDYEWAIEPVNTYPAECKAESPVNHPHFTIARLPHGSLGHDHAEANARLITAAPELLDACEWLYDALQPAAAPLDGSVREEYRKKLATAIYKAKAH